MASFTFLQAPVFGKTFSISAPGSLHPSFFFYHLLLLSLSQIAFTQSLSMNRPNRVNITFITTRFTEITFLVFSHPASVHEHSFFYFLYSSVLLQGCTSFLSFFRFGTNVRHGVLAPAFPLFPLATVCPSQIPSLSSSPVSGVSPLNRRHRTVVFFGLLGLSPDPPPSPCRALNSVVNTSNFSRSSR